MRAHAILRSWIDDGWNKDELERDFVVVRLFYSTLATVEFVETIDMNFNAMFGAVGGTLGLFGAFNDDLTVVGLRRHCVRAMVWLLLPVECVCRHSACSVCAFDL